MTEYLTPTPDNDTPDEAEFQAFLDRFKDVWQAVETVKDELTSLYTEGKIDEANQVIDDVADQITENDPRFQENITQLRELRKARSLDSDAEAAIRQRQKEIRAEIRAFVVNEAGLPDETRFSQVEQARQAVADRLETTFSDDYSPREALVALDIVQPTDDGAEYHFPTELVPASTNELWETYLAAVCQHVQTQRDLSRGLIDDKDAVVQADKTRTIAHNAVTKELHAILNFNEAQWSRLDTRELLAKIRDFTLPTYESAVSDASEVFVREHQSHLRVAAALASLSH